MGTSASKEKQFPFYSGPSLFSVNRAQCDSAPAPPPLPGGEDAPPPPPLESSSDSSKGVDVPNPGPYEFASNDAKRLVTLDTFDGMRFDISKQLSPYMAVVHSFWAGTTMLGSERNKSYSFVTQVADEFGSLKMARVDFDRGSLDGRVHQAILGGMALAKLQLSLSQEGSHDQMIGDLDFGGQTWTGNLKYGSAMGGSLFGINYYQSVTPRLAVGCEGTFIGAQQMFTNSYTAKYTMPAAGGEGDMSTDPESPDAPSSTLIATVSTAGPGQLNLNYKRIVTPNRVTLGAELQMDPSLEAVALIGAEFNLTRSKVHLCVDGTGKVQTTVEAKLGLGNAPTVQFAGELDHRQGTMRFGYGLNINS